MKEVGTAIKRIGWKHFTGKLAIEMRCFQHDYLLQSRSHIRIDSWLRGLIENLLVMLHEQWLCRNLCKHHRSRGAKALEARAELQVEIERQLELGSDDLPDHSKCLLNICPEHLYLYAMPTDQQQYWVNAAEAARDEALLLAQTHQPETHRPPAKKLVTWLQSSKNKRQRNLRKLPTSDRMINCWDLHLDAPEEDMSQRID